MILKVSSLIKKYKPKYLFNFAASHMLIILLKMQINLKTNILGTHSHLAHLIIKKIYYQDLDY